MFNINHTSRCSYQKNTISYTLILFDLKFINYRVIQHMLVFVIADSNNVRRNEKFPI